MHHNTIHTAIKQRDLGFDWASIAEHLRVDEHELRNAVRTWQAGPKPRPRKRAAVRAENRRRWAALKLERDCFVRRMLRNGFSIEELERVVRMTQRTMSELLEH